MTSTLPWRRMILHLSHIFLTEGRTFIISSFRLMYLVLYIYTQPLVFVCYSMCNAVLRRLLSACLRCFARAAHHAKTPLGAKTHNFCMISSQTVAETVRLLEPIGNAPAVQIIYRQLNRDLIARQDLDVMHPHLARDMSQDIVPVLELNPKHCVWQRLEYCPLELDNVLFGQILFLRKKGH